MLWSTIAILCGLVLCGLTGANIAKQSWTRAVEFAWLLVFFGANAIGGAIVFQTAHGLDFWVWKPLLVTSAFVYVGLLAQALRLQRRELLSEELEKPSAEHAIGLGLGSVGSLAGFAAVASVWLV